MRYTLGFLLLMGFTLMLTSVESADSSGKSRNREDRFDLKNEGVGSTEADDLISSCESAESVESSSCRQRKNKYHKRKTFRFAI
ncbi:uncharacterized protein LOC108087526 [Drosophila ficusphila]|uniref:uncharacterized protein LOC108087526 n=1 Tax=Drosophila ficusphila TaxID=30025 RepID=UPI0007E78ED1|nr:uncharacterized protein LOC108087526 [Drosophila ficusphila]